MEKMKKRKFWKTIVERKGNCDFLECHKCPIYVDICGTKVAHNLKHKTYISGEVELARLADAQRWLAEHPKKVKALDGSDQDRAICKRIVAQQGCGGISCSDDNCPLFAGEYSCTANVTTRSHTQAKRWLDHHPKKKVPCTCDGCTKEPEVPKKPELIQIIPGKFYKCGEALVLATEGEPEDTSRFCGIRVKSAPGTSFTHRIENDWAIDGFRPVDVELIEEQ